MAGGAVRADLVGAGEHAHGAPDHAGAMGAHIGALVVEEFVVDAEEAPVLVHRGANAVALLARMIGGDQILAAILDPFHRAADVVELYGAAKIPHVTRDLLARTLGRSHGSVHLHEGHVGGGFGIRGELYPEDVLVCLAAKRIGRPVKWIEDRREHLVAANHSRQQLHRLKAGIDREGRILAIDDLYFHDQGAYLRTHGPAWWI